MSASEVLEGLSLVSASGRTWQVLTKLETKPGETPGQFSVGYLVENDRKEKHFLKASDLGMFIRPDESILDALDRATTAHKFEKDVLEYCHGNAMDRVVTAVDFGEIQIDHEGFRDVVFYLIFEWATGDVRSHVTRGNSLSLAFATSTLHNVFVATNQMHKAQIAHNDLKPANTLVIDDKVQKVADLGRATSHHHPAAHDAYLCTGDTRFAPPEQLYPTDQNCAHISRELRRRVGDLYNLGSLVYYMLTARMFTPEVISSLRPEVRPRTADGGSEDSYQNAVPFWKEAHAALCTDISDVASQRFGPGVSSEVTDLRGMVVQLCEPDPLVRGHPLNKNRAQDPYGLERYISGLNSLRLKLRVKSA